MYRQILVVLLLIGAAAGQDLPETPMFRQAAFSQRAPVSTRDSKQAVISQRASISRRDWVMFAGLGAEIVADGVTTRVLYQRRYYEDDPLARPFVQAGVPGQVAASLMAAGGLAGAWWALHRSHRDRMARGLLWSAAAVEGANDARQFAILRGSRRLRAEANPR